MAAEVIGAVSLELLLDTSRFNKALGDLDRLINNGLGKSFNSIEKTMAKMEKMQIDLTKLEVQKQIEIQKTLQATEKTKQRELELTKAKLQGLSTTKRVKREQEDYTEEVEKTVNESKTLAGLNIQLEIAQEKTTQAVEKTAQAIERTTQEQEKTKRSIANILVTENKIKIAKERTLQAEEKTSQSVMNLCNSQNKVVVSANNLKKSYANVKSTANYAYSQILKNVGKLIDRHNTLYKSSKNIGSKATWNGMLTSLSSGVYLAKNLYMAFDRVASKVKEVADLGGQLVETQNVIDTKLGTSAGGVSAWALSDTTKDTFGMNALTSSEFAARFGGMMTTSGFSDEISGEYARILSGLVADESSLWNKNYDDTFSAFMSGIFGNTTRAMKNYAVDLSVASLQEYALSEGIEKSYYAMTNQEKLCLKISKTIKTLTGDVGDFARTQNTWANQTRMLSENFEQLKMTIGQGLIVALTPVVSILNTILEKLITLAVYFKNFMISIFGDDALQSGFAQWGEDLENFEDTAQDTASGVEKAFKSMFLPIDDIVQLNKKDSSSGSGSIGSGIDQAFLDLLEPGMYDKLYKKWEEMEQESSAWLIRLTQETEGLWGAINKFKGFMKSEDGLPRFLQICKDFANNIDWEKINTSLDNFWESAEPVAEIAWDGLMDFYEYFLAPLGNWVLNEGLTSLLDILTKFNTDIDWERINTSLENFWKALEPKVEAMGRGFIDFLNDLADWAIKFINDNCPAALDAVTNFLNETDDSKFEKLGYGIGVVATAFLGLKVALEMLSPLLSVGTTVMGWATNSSLLSGVSGTTGAAGASATGGAGLMATLTSGGTWGPTSVAGVSATGAGAVAIIAAGIAMIVDGIDTLWEKVPQFREDMKEILGDIGTDFQDFINGLTPSFEHLGASVENLIISISENEQFLAGLWGAMVLLFGQVESFIALFLDILVVGIDFIVNELANLVTFISGILQIIIGIITLDTDMIVSGLQDMITGWFNFFGQIFISFEELILSVVDYIMSLIGNIGEMFSTGFKDSFLQGWENVKQTIWQAINGTALEIQDWVNKTFGLNLNFVSEMPVTSSNGNSQASSGNSFKTLNAATNMYNPQMQRLSTGTMAAANIKSPYNNNNNNNNQFNGYGFTHSNNNNNRPIVIHNYMDVDGETMAQNVNTFNAKMNNR